MNKGKADHLGPDLSRRPLSLKITREKRRGFDMGVTVRQKEPGKGNPWWVFISHKGQRTSRRVGDKQAAIEAASQIQAKLALGQFNVESDKSEPEKEEPKRFLFKDYAEEWMRITVPATCKASTQWDYRNLLDNHVLPILGEIEITEVSRGKVKDFLLGKANEGYAHSTVGHMKNAISGILIKAMDDEIISANPAYSLKKLSKKKERDKVDPLNKDELKLLLDVARKHYSQHYPLFLVLARTGMRVGEGMALQWGDVDFHGRFINVQRGLSRGRIETPKSGKTRKVDMSLQLTETLMDLKKQGHKSVVIPFGGDRSSLPDNVVQMPAQEGEGPDWIFSNGAGGFMDVNNWRRRTFNSVLKKAGLRKIRIHDIRHTYASLLIEDKQTLVYVRDQLGHSSIAVTVDTYGHLVPGGNREAVDRLDDSLPMHSSAPPLHPKEKGATAANP